ncbi:MAG: nuclease-related domain-containing protein [Thermoleophilia bacterium]
MIAKMPDTDRGTDPRNAAGLAAEKTIAFYLRRAFREDPDVFVFNDLRLEHEGEVAQIDHLVLHHGGMPSPVLQARRQEALLRAKLRANSERLRDRMLMGRLQARFNNNWPIDIFVAISDRGRIVRKTEIPELRKADQVPDEITKIVGRHKRGRWSLNPLNGDGDLWLSSVEMGRLVQFLLSGHTLKAGGHPTGETGAAATRDVKQPVSSAASAHDESPPVLSAPPPATALAGHATILAGPATGEPQPRCRHCGSTDLLMRYARTSRPYFFRCLPCGGNSPARWDCAACGAAARISKRGPDYFRVCTACGTTAHIFRNPEDAPSD